MDSQPDRGHAITEPRHGRSQQASSPARLDQWLTTLVERGGSDLLLIPGAPASIRFEGEVGTIDREVLDGPEIEAAVVPALTPHGLRQYRETMPASELLMVGYGARQHIRRSSLQHLHQEITITRNKGSFSLEESLGQLVKFGHIEREDALAYANHPDDLSGLLKN
ncbi:MAG: hypothetical protein ACRD20_15385 [Terriglobales bacterium]